MGDGHGGARPGAGAKPKPIVPNENSKQRKLRLAREQRRMRKKRQRAVQRALGVTSPTVPATPAAKPTLSPAGMQHVIEELRARAKAPERSPFKIAQHPKAATPTKSHMMAMDESLSWAGQQWAVGMLNAAGSEGLVWPGFTYLAELAQRPEYRVISETIATEMTRKWIKFKGTNTGKVAKAKGATDAEAAGEQAEADDKTGKIKDLTDFMDHLQVRDRFAELALHDGFFGRSHLFLDDGNADDRAETKTPIGDGRDRASRKKIGKNWLKALRCVEPVWVYPTTYNAQNPLRADWYNPQVWYVMGQEIHRSRLLTFIGRDVPDLLKPAYSFGGISLSQLAQPYVDIWLKTRQSVGDLIHSFSVMVLMTDLQTILQPNNAAGLIQRVELFNLLRDNNGAFVVNKATEDFKNVSASLSGLHELQAQAQEHMASVARIPLVKFTGISPAGLNASSEGEMRAFYDTIAAFQNKFFRPNLNTVVSISQCTLWGQPDPDIVYEFEPLWALSEKEEGERRKAEAETDDIFVNMGAISPEEVRTKIAGDPNSPYHGIDPDDVPDLAEEEEGGLMPGGDKPGDNRAEPGNRKEGGAQDAVVPFVDVAFDALPAFDAECVGLHLIAEDTWAWDEAPFEESKHPRDNGGKFASGSGGGGGASAEPAAKTPGSSSSGVFKSKKEHVAHLLTEGTTAADILKATGWPSVSVPAMAKAAGMKLEKFKEGGVTKYKGTPMTVAEKAAAAAETAAKAKAAGVKPEVQAAAEIIGKPVAEVAKAIEEKPKTPPASAAELEKAKSKNPVPGHMVPNLPATELEAFNQKFSGANTPTTMQGLTDKVNAFKAMQAQSATATQAAATQAAEQAAKEAAQQHEASVNFHKQPKSDAKTKAALTREWTQPAAASWFKRAAGLAGAGTKHPDIAVGDMAALVGYSGSAFGKMNATLRSGKMTPHMHEAVLACNTALSKLPNFVGQVRRGTSVPGDIAAHYEVGMVIEERGFTSTSKGAGFGGDLEFKIQSKTGKDISQLSSHPHEGEVLFRSGSRFRVVKKEGNTVHMEEVEQFHHV